MPESPTSEPVILALAFSRSDLDAVLKPEQYSPEKLVDLLDQGMEPRLYLQSVKVGTLTLRDHTLRVLRLFEQYFAHKPLPGGINIGLFRLILALHDIGKPIGRIYGQHEITVQIITDVLGKLGFAAADINLAAAMTSHDTLGYLLRREPGYEYIEDGVKVIIEMARRANIPPQVFLELLIVLYSADAGSYEHLAALFKFEPQTKTILYAPRVRQCVLDCRTIMGDALSGRLEL